MRERKGEGGEREGEGEGERGSRRVGGRSERKFDKM